MKTIDVVAAIIVKDSEILATQRGYGEFEGGWEFPGGKVEEGETPEQAIVREIHEELNAKIAVKDFLVQVEQPGITELPSFTTLRNVSLLYVRSPDKAIGTR